MKNIFKLIFILGVLLMSCEDLVDDINKSPNKLQPEDVEAELFLNGAMLANTVAQVGHLNRIAGLWSGQLIGFTSLYANIFGYSISTAESVTTWSRIYVGTLPNLRHIRTVAPDDQLINGIAKVVEANAIGTAASLFGDIPYSEVNNNTTVPDPQFDSQMDVFNGLINLLDEAIADLNAAPAREISFDLYYAGDKIKWIEAANTLKARYYLQMKDYNNAYLAAENGISSADNSLKYRPRGDANRSEGDKNLFWEILEGSRAGDIGTGDSYLMQLLEPTNALSRSNAKTDETARFAYFTIDESGGSDNEGIIEQFEPQNIITFEENMLILAETGARTIDFNTGLGHLNELRAYLNTGEFLNVNFENEPLLYEAYVVGDFMAGGMENADGLPETRALLREIIEERYISGFGMFMAFNDARRLRKDDTDLMVPFPLNIGSATLYPERLPYSDDELNTNSNAPTEDPGIFTKTQVNN